jgi:hypothetical protein
LSDDVASCANLARSLPRRYQGDADCVRSNGNIFLDEECQLDVESDPLDAITSVSLKQLLQIVVGLLEVLESILLAPAGDVSRRLSLEIAEPYVLDEVPVLIGRTIMIAPNLSIVRA